MRKVAALIVGIAARAGHLQALDDKQEMTLPTDGNWIRVSDELLSGKGMEPYNMTHIGQFTDWSERKVLTAMHKIPFINELRVNVVESPGNAVHIPSFPSDEFLYIIVGGITLTPDNTKTEQTFYAGEWIMVPRGWAGTWRVHSPVFRELGLVAASYFSGSRKEPIARGWRDVCISSGSP
jgi:hypothetical protein